MGKCLVLFVEGDTEVEFYKAIIGDARLRRPNKQFDISIEIKNVKGVGGFKNNALRKFIKEIKPKYDTDTDFVVALCRDTDVFELSPKPPIKWEEVEKEFNLPAVDIHTDSNGGLKRLIETVLNYVGEN